MRCLSGQNAYLTLPGPQSLCGTLIELVEMLPECHDDECRAFQSSGYPPEVYTSRVGFVI